MNRRLDALRRSVIILLCGVGACRSVPRRQCFPASGSEVWIERHLRAQPSADGRSSVEVRFLPDTSAQRRRWAQALVLVNAGREANSQYSTRRDVTAQTPAALRLAPGAYRLMVLGLTYERVTHSVDVAPDDSIVIQARLPGAAYCEETVTVM